MLNKQYYLLILASLLVFESSQAEENGYPLSPFIGQNDAYQFPVDTSNGQASNGTMQGIYGGLELNRMYSWDIVFQQRGALDTESTSTASIVESALKYDYFLSNNYSIYARLGVAYWDSKKSQSTLKDVSPMVETGLTYWVNDKFKVSGGYQYIDEIGNYNSHTLLLSAAFTLGSSVPRLPSASSTNVAMWLEGKEILPEQIETKGEGASKPITSNMTPESRSLNRCVEMRLLTVDDSETSCEIDTP
ncbi:outer membrane beta-barrel protein [Vibrio sp. M250220]|uniref:outer membrane beta-barrel protein n=1 Tax=Vibrio sp. M250220 TaxID=3020894 RepID=UPI002F403819